MLSQLIKDATDLVATMPNFQAAIDAVTSDLAGGKIDTKQLAVDAQALAETANEVKADAEALAVDLQALPQATYSEAECKNFGDELVSAAELRGSMSDGPEGTRLQNLICAGIPIYNIFAALYSLPALPLPAFCTPKPTP